MNNKIEFLRTDKIYLFGLIVLMIAKILFPDDIEPGNIVVFLFLSFFIGVGLILMLVGLICRIVRTVKDPDFRAKKEQIVVTVLESLVPLYMILLPIGMKIFVIATA